MPFSVDSSHIKFFNQNSKIEFENLLNLNQLKTLKEALKKVKATQNHSLSNGFELWRSNLNLKPILCRSSFAKIAGQLKNLRQLRYGYSQYLGPDCYSDETSFLYRKSFIKELVCGLCLCIAPSEEPESPFFPDEEGSGIFFDMDPDFLLKFPKSSGKYIYIFFADYRARFYLQDETSSHQTYFKKLGYHHGDFLRDELNPSFDQILL